MSGKRSNVCIHRYLVVGSVAYARRVRQSVGLVVKDSVFKCALTDMLPHQQNKIDISVRLTMMRILGHADTRD